MEFSEDIYALCFCSQAHDEELDEIFDVIKGQFKHGMGYIGQVSTQVPDEELQGVDEEEVDNKSCSDGEEENPLLKSNKFGE